MNLPGILWHSIIGVKFGGDIREEMHIEITLALNASGLRFLQDIFCYKRISLPF